MSTSPAGRPYIALFALVAAFLIVHTSADELSTTAPDPHARSSVIYPPQDLRLHFSHAQHLSAPTSMACVDCHANAPLSVRASDRLLPAMDACLTCHSLEQTPCSTCHPDYQDQSPRFPDGVHPTSAETARLVLNPPTRPDIPTPQLHFPHRMHTDAGVECETCHQGVRNVELATRAQLPLMAECLSCHDDGAEDCTTCHLSDRDGRLITELPSGSLVPKGRFRPDDHRLDFNTRHATASRADSAACTSCHSEDWCLDCHNNTVKPIAMHPPNYALTHAFDAQTQGGDCTGSCHVAQDFCVSCHERTGVGEFDRPPSGNRLHPEGFVSDVSSPNFHGPAAQRNIVACVSCHQENNCVRCHSAINPHPAGYTGICGAQLSRNETACITCHGGSDASLERLRALCR